MRNIQLIKYKQKKILTEIRIECFDSENEKEFMILMDFIKCIGSGKKIFVDLCCANINESFDKNCLAASAANLCNREHTSLFLKNINLDSIKQNIFNSRYSIIYIFHHNTLWEDFLNTKPKKESELFKKDILVATITVGEMESVMISINNQHYNDIKLFLERMTNVGYKVKRTKISM